MCPGKVDDTVVFASLIVVIASLSMDTSLI